MFKSAAENPTYLSIFKKNKVCTECNWFKPHNNCIKYEVCPLCGAEKLVVMVGRFTIKDCSDFWTTWTESVAFTTRDGKVYDGVIK